MRSLMRTARTPVPVVRSAGAAHTFRHPPEQRLQRWVGNEATGRLFATAAPAPWHAASGAVPRVVEDALLSPGEPLPGALRAEMEARFRADFGDVQIHRGADAAQSAAAVRAKAYTVGRHIVFGTGEYAPGSVPGRELVAHELAHVVQQNRGGAPASPHTDAALEAGARAAADAVVQGAGVVEVSGAAGVGLARQESQEGGAPEYEERKRSGYYDPLNYPTLDAWISKNGQERGPWRDEELAELRQQWEAAHGGKKYPPAADPLDAGAPLKPPQPDLVNETEGAVFLLPAEQARKERAQLIEGGAAPPDKARAGLVPTTGGRDVQKYVHQEVVAGAKSAIRHDPLAVIGVAGLSLALYAFGDTDDATTLASLLEPGPEPTSDIAMWSQFYTGAGLSLGESFGIAGLQTGGRLAAPVLTRAGVRAWRNLRLGAAATLIGTADATGLGRGAGSFTQFGARAVPQLTLEPAVAAELGGIGMEGRALSFRPPTPEPRAPQALPGYRVETRAGRPTIVFGNDAPSFGYRPPPLTLPPLAASPSLAPAQETASAIMFRMRDEAVATAQQMVGQEITQSGNIPRNANARVGTYADAIFKAHVRQAIADGRLPGTLRVSPTVTINPRDPTVRLPQTDVWDTATGEAWDLTTASARGIEAHETLYIGRRMPDGTVITRIHFLVYHARP